MVKRKQSKFGYESVHTIGNQKRAYDVYHKGQCIGNVHRVGISRKWTATVTRHCNGCTTWKQLPGVFDFRDQASKAILEALKNG